MRVEVIAATESPMELIAFCAGVCYGRRDASPGRLRRCYKSGHMSVFEHASATFLVEGISRACSHQLVRHRMASYSQESQRYTVMEGEDWYVKPEAFDDYTDWFDRQMRDAKAAYEGALSRGIKPEDARALLPQATKTNIAVTMNVRELFHFFNLRQASDAQKEIRELAAQMEAALEARNDQWGALVRLRRHA